MRLDCHYTNEIARLGHRMQSSYSCVKKSLHTISSMYRHQPQCHHRNPPPCACFQITLHLNGSPQEWVALKLQRTGRLT